VTRLGVLYIESFGNPRKFARTARRVAATMPLLTVMADEGPARGRQEALFDQAGVITTGGFGELIETTALLATQPVPAGRTVGIVSNVGSAGVLAAGACAGRGLTVHRPRGLTRRRLRTIVPGTGAVTGPVNTTAAISGEGFRRCLELVAADENVHALMALVMPTGATGDLVTAIQQADVGIPLVAVVLNDTQSVRLLPRAEGRSAVPAYNYPEAAVAALARAAGYGARRAGPRGRVPEFPGIRTADARALVHDLLGRAPADGWLAPGPAADLLCCYGITLADGRDAPAGPEVIIRVTADPTFGPLVEFGLDDPAAEVLADRSARLTPLTDTDADTLIRSIRSFPLLRGPGGGPGADLEALRDLLLRVSRLAEDLPEVAELDLDPVIAGPDGTAIVNARIKLVPHEPYDPFLRRLR
jgi:acyl-CoA synthetase (NDP forming)